MNALMAIPNLIGLIGLSAVIIAETKVIIRIINSEKQNKQRNTFETWIWQIANYMEWYF